MSRQATADIVSDIAVSAEVNHAVLLERIELDLALVSECIERQVDSSTPDLDGVLRDFCLHPGKRIRPRLLLLSSYLGNAHSASATAAAAAIEIVHNASLVHDDLIDNSLERRGVPCLQVTKGSSCSILYGDLLFGSAISLLAKQGNAQAVGVMSRAIERMACGELLQQEQVGMFELDLAAYQQIVSCKTGALLSAAMELGGLFGGCDARQCAALRTAGEKLGIAFQVCDDIGDYLHSRERQGRDPGNDVSDRKITAPLIFARQWADVATAQRLAENFAAAARDAVQFPHLLEAIHQSQGFARACDFAERMFDDGIAELDVFGKSEASDLLIQFINGLMLSLTSGYSVTGTRQ
ncbi:MAG: polyprenyl synthetase family protein [Novosphingobium sp.]